MKTNTYNPGRKGKSNSHKAIFALLLCLFVGVVSATPAGNVDCSAGTVLLDTAGAAYTMNASSTIATGICFSVTAANVSLNCLGFNITGGNDSQGIKSVAFNTTISNCNIRNFQSGVFLQGATNNTIMNTLVANLTNGIGFYVLTSGGGHTFNNCTANVTAGTGGGFTLASGTENSKILNSFANSTSIAVSIAGHGNSIINTTIYSSVTNSHALYLNTVQNNTISNTTVYGQYRALYIYAGLYNNITNSRFLNVGGVTGVNYAVHVDGASIGNIIRNNTITSFGTNVATFATYFTETAGGNSVILNNMSSQSILIKDLNGSNFYNATYGGINQGNIYANMNASNLSGGVMSSIPNYYAATGGTSYPYNGSTSGGKFVCAFAGCGDYAPLYYVTPITVQLTVNYTSGGTAVGSNNTATPPANLTINATASAGYSFTSWTENCNGTVNNATNPNTYITVNDDVACFAQANFAENAPIIQTSTITPTAAYQYNSLLGYCNATTGATTVTYNYTWYLNGAANASGSVGPFTQGVNTNVANISSASMAVGQIWILQCMAYNANGASAFLNSSAKTIMNTTPSITAISISPASPTIASNLTCIITVTDNEHATTNITGNWSKNGAVLLAFTYNNLANNTATTAATLNSGNFSKNDNVSCTARAFDGVYYSTAATSANKTILNSAPTNPTVNTFVNATVGHWFTVNGSVTDADGGSDIATVTITPSLGTCVQMSNSTSGTSFSVKYNCTSTTPGTATVHIGFTDASAAYANNSSTNAYPDHAASLTAPTITPTTIFNASIATCNVGVFSDIDGDTENVSARTYAWQYNGATVTGETAVTFDLGAYGANVSDNVSCSIFATNSTWATSNATNMSANKTITPNYSPQITVQNTFTNSTAGHSFTVFAGAVDTDAGDSIAFTNITTTFGTCTYVSNTTSGGAMNVTYLCTSTTPGSTNITIRFTDTIAGAYNITTSSNNAYPDHAPTLTAPTITPTLAHLNDTLTCNPGVFSDVDNDTENVSARSYKWYVNGVLTATTQTLASGAFAVGDNITCTENSTNSSWTLTAQASSATFSNILGFFYTTYGNTSGVVGVGAAFDYSADVMETATGNADAFGLLVMAAVFAGFYIVGSRYTQERALVYATFVTTVVAFLLVSGNFLNPNWLILSIIALLAAIYFANRVG